MQQVEIQTPEDMNVFPGVESEDTGLTVRELASLMVLHAIVSRKDFDWQSEQQTERALDYAANLGELMVFTLKGQ